MPRRQSKHAPAKVQATIRQREVAELRAQKMTMQEIADQLGISKPRVHQLLEEWDKNFRMENADRAEQIREEQLDEIRLLKKVWFPRVAASATPSPDDEHPLPPASSKDLMAYMKILSHEADLAGAKAATTVKTELTGKDGDVIRTSNTNTNANLDLSNLTMEELLQLAKASNPDA